MTQTVVGTTAEEIIISYIDPRVLSPHAEAQLIPMSKEDEQSLRDDIAKNGILHPLDITADQHILDGVHRWQSAIHLELRTIPAVIYRYTEPEQESIHAIRANLKRRQLNEGQRAMLGLKLLPLEKELAAKRLKSSGKIGATIRWDDSQESPVKENVTTVSHGVLQNCSTPCEEQPVGQSQAEAPKKNKKNKTDGYEHIGQLFFQVAVPRFFQ